MEACFVANRALADAFIIVGGIDGRRRVLKPWVADVHLSSLAGSMAWRLLCESHVRLDHG